MLKIGKVRLNRGSGDNCVYSEFNVVKEAFTEPREPQRSRPRLGSAIPYS